VDPPGQPAGWGSGGGIFGSELGLTRPRLPFRRSRYSRHRRRLARPQGARFSLLGQGDRHCGSGDRGWRRHMWGPRPSRSAPVSNRVVTQATIIDPHHPLYGRRFELSPPACGHRAGRVSIALADGRQRWVPLTATDLGGDRESLASHALQRVSMRTLLPLAQYIRALLANPRKVFDGPSLDSDRHGDGTGLSGRADGAGAAVVAGDGAGGAAALGAAGGSVAPADADGDRRSCVEGDGSC